MILAWGLAFSALILFGFCAIYLTLIVFRNYLPSIEAEVIDATLVGQSTDKTKLVMFVVRYKISPSQEGVIKYLFPGGNVDAASKSARFERLNAAYLRGARIRLHHIPGFQMLGYISESPVFRMETAMLLMGFSISGLIVTSAIYFLILHPTLM